MKIQINTKFSKAMVRECLTMTIAESRNIEYDWKSFSPTMQYLKDLMDTILNGGVDAYIYDGLQNNTARVQFFFDRLNDDSFLNAVHQCLSHQ